MGQAQGLGHVAGVGGAAEDFVGLVLARADHLEHERRVFVNRSRSGHDFESMLGLGECLDGTPHGQKVGTPTHDGDARNSDPGMERPKIDDVQAADCDAVGHHRVDLRGVLAATEQARDDFGGVPAVLDRGAPHHALEPTIRAHDPGDLDRGSRSGVRSIVESDDSNATVAGRKGRGHPRFQCSHHERDGQRRGRTLGVVSVGGFEGHLLQKVENRRRSRPGRALARCGSLQRGYRATLAASGRRCVGYADFDASPANRRIVCRERTLFDSKRGSRAGPWTLVSNSLSGQGTSAEAASKDPPQQTATPMVQTARKWRMDDGAMRWRGLAFASMLSLGCSASDLNEEQAEAGTGEGVDDEDDVDWPREPAGPNAAPDPSTWGPFPVGVRTFEVDASMGNEDRSLLVEVWYPAVEAAREMPKVTYGPEDLLTAEALELLSTELEAEIATEAVRDVELAFDTGPYPLVFFSHGSGGIRMQSTYLTVALASHGYVVVAPGHTGNTLSDIVIEGDLTNESLLASLGHRTGDLDVVLESLKAGAVPEVSDAIDFETIGVCGHSFGALTSIRWLGRGADVDAVVAQAPPSFDILWIGMSAKLSAFDVPTMLQVGGADLTTPVEDADSVWEQMSPPRSRLDLGTAGHFTFSDLCGVDTDAILDSVDLGLADALDDGCLPDNIDPDEAATVIRNFTIGHFNATLRGSEASRTYLSEEVGRSLVRDPLSFVEER